MLDIPTSVNLLFARHIKLEKYSVKRTDVVFLSSVGTCIIFQYFTFTFTDLTHHELGIIKLYGLFNYYRHCLMHIARHGSFNEAV